VWAARGLPCLVAFGSRSPICSTLGVVRPNGLAFLSRLPPPDPVAKADDEAPFELHISGYGPDSGGEPGLALAAHLAAWQAARRPGTTHLRLRVYPPEPPLQPQPGEIVTRKSATQLVIDWPSRPGP
jgi:hypothetical protein